MKRRILLKLSGEELSGGQSGAFDKDTLARLVSEIDALTQTDGGIEVGLVVGGGNIWRGRSAALPMDAVKADQVGMLATLMNAIVLAEAFRAEAPAPGEPYDKSPVQRCVVMTPYDVGNFTVRYTKDAAVAAMKGGLIPIFAGGTGHPFLSTDTIAALRACELRADALLYGKATACVCSADPRKTSDYKKYKTLSYDTVLQNQLEVADISAIAMTKAQNIPSVVFGLRVPGGITAAGASLEALYDIGGTFVANGLEDSFYV